VEHLQGRSSTSSRGSLCCHLSLAQHPLPFPSLSCMRSLPAHLSSLPRSPGMAARPPGLCRSSPSRVICHVAEGALGPTIQTPSAGRCYTGSGPGLAPGWHRQPPALPCARCRRAAPPGPAVQPGLSAPDCRLVQPASTRGT